MASAAMTVAGTRLAACTEDPNESEAIRAQTTGSSPIACRTAFS